MTSNQEAKALHHRLQIHVRGTRLWKLRRHSLETIGLTARGLTSPRPGFGSSRMEGTLTFWTVDSHKIENYSG